MRGQQVFAIAILLGAATLDAQRAAQAMVDVHVHYNGQKAFLQQMLDRLDKHDGMAFILTPPQNLEEVQAFIKQHPKRFTGFGSIRLDDPNAVALVDRFHNAGFRGLGEMSGPLKNYDDKSYWPIYERARQYHMIVWVHT